MFDLLSFSSLYLSHLRSLGPRSGLVFSFLNHLLSIYLCFSFLLSPVDKTEFWFGCLFVAPQAPMLPTPCFNAGRILCIRLIKTRNPFIIEFLHPSGFQTIQKLNLLAKKLLFLLFVYCTVDLIVYWAVDRLLSSYLNVSLYESFFYFFQNLDNFFPHLLLWMMDRFFWITISDQQKFSSSTWSTFFPIVMYWVYHGRLPWFP